jgi:outer membrane protein assembly factor BamB
MRSVYFKCVYTEDAVVVLFNGREKAMKFRMYLKVVLWSVLVTVTAYAAPDWPQWRGPQRDGVLPSFVEPEDWPDELRLVWKQEVGVGHSSPLAVDGRVYLHARQDEREEVTCRDLATGRVLWKSDYAAPYRMNPAARSHGKGPKSTPVIHGNKLVTLGISGILSCFDTKDGRLVWQKDFSGEFGETSPLYGAAMSMMVDADRLIAHVGGHGDGALFAFEVGKGDVVWRWDGDGPGYASPIIVEVGGVRQLVTQSQDHLVGLSPGDGELLWSIPFKTAYTQNTVTPVHHGQNLIFSGLDNGVMAVRVSRGGGKWRTETVWETRDVSMYMSSPVLIGDWLFGMSHFKRGQFFCLNARTGEVQWTSDGRQGDNAALLGTDEVLFALTTNAELIVVRATSGNYDVVRSYEVADTPTWAHPVILENQILIKDESHLALWRLR